MWRRNSVIPQQKFHEWSSRVFSVSHEDSRLQTKLGRQKLIYITEGIPFYVITLASS